MSARWVLISPVWQITEGLDGRESQGANCGFFFFFSTPLSELSEFGEARTLKVIQRCARRTIQQFCLKPSPTASMEDFPDTNI